LKGDAKKTQAEIDAMETKHTKSEEELKRLRKGKAYQELANIEKDIANVEERLATIESRGRNLIGPLLRVLRKYARVAADKVTKRVTESYIKNPQTTFFEKADGAVIITRILKEVCAMAERGELAIDKKEREKVDNAMSNLSSIKEEHTAVKNEEQCLKDALASSSVKKEEAIITAELKNAEEDIKRLRAEVESTKAGAKEKKKEIKRLKKQLEEGMSKERETEVTIEI
jgi:flagellar motility protein MotE (MotC chaperone)